MIEMRWARPTDREAIIDFIDYVFSKAHQPHDFATLLPKLYGDDADTTQHHFIILEDGRIVASILAYPVAATLNGQRIMTIGVGSVSVHPRARSRGYMQHLLGAVDQRAAETDAAYAVLGGQRQRYGYSGYSFSGMHMNGELTTDNVRHALRSADTAGYTLAPMTQEHVPAALALHQAQPCFCERSEADFLRILRSWTSSPYAILHDGTLVGYAALRESDEPCHVGELNAADTHLPAALKLLSGRFGDLAITCAPWQTALAGILSEICDDFSISCDHAYKFYHPERVHAALGVGRLSFSGFAQPLPLCTPSPDCV